MNLWVENELALQISSKKATERSILCTYSIHDGKNLGKKAKNAGWEKCQKSLNFGQPFQPRKAKYNQYYTCTHFTPSHTCQN